MKKKLLTLLSIVFFISAFVGCGSNKEASNDTDNTNANKVLTIDEAKKKYPENTYGTINETLDDGVLIAKLKSYSKDNELKGAVDEVWKSGADSEFITVKIDIAASKQPLTEGLYSVSDLFIIEDQDGTQYVANDDITNSIRVERETLDYFDTINPKVLKEMQVVFEVPKDTKPFRLSIKNEYNDNKWIVAYF